MDGTNNVYPKQNWTAQYSSGPPEQYSNSLPPQYSNGPPAQYSNGPPAQYLNGPPGQLQVNLNQPQPFVIQTQAHYGNAGQSRPITLSYGPNQQNTICPSCNEYVTTSIESKATSKTHLLALCLCCFGCYLCCCIPYCVDSCQNQDHYCPNCKQYLGTYNG